MIDINKNYDNVNPDREARAKALNIAVVSGSYSEEDKTCDTCIFWKRYMLRSQPNTIHLADKFPCRHKDIQTLPTDEYYKVGIKTKDDTCERWQYER